MVWQNNPERTCNIKMYDPPYVLLHHPQLQIIHGAEKRAVLNWHVCKSAATGPGVSERQLFSFRRLTAEL